ncbi:MAG: hypothetical protein WAO02_07530 [Verrucomicrobiia bacterium]
MAKQKPIYPLRVSLRLLSPSADTATAAEGAAALLNQAQRVFIFEVKAGPPVQLAGSETLHKWATIESVLSEPEVRQEANFIFGILDEPIESNWFSHAAWGQDIGFITTHSWEYISALPVVSYLAYEVVENLVELLWIADEMEGQRFIAEVVHHGEGRGCLNDMCEFKPRIGIKIRTGDICPDCLNLLQSRLEKKELEAIQRMLDAIRLIALGREPGETDEESDIPGRIPASRPPPAPQAMEVPVFRGICSAPVRFSREECSPPARVSGNSPREVDQHYPFPVAHCFRAMRVEVSGTRKFKMLLQLYAVITKYITLALLASRSRATTTENPETMELLRRLRRGSHGTWGETCLRLLRERMADPTPGFMDYLVKNISVQDVDACERISKDFVKLRNDTEGHGFVESEDTYEKLFLKQLEPVQRLLALMQPLANYTFFQLVKVNSHRGGNCVCEARILHGSNPLFEVEQLVSATVPESDCLLRHPLRDEHLNLWPWLLLDDCPQCKRQMVFLYDSMEHNNTVFREYPNNHCKRNGEVCAAIRERIG